WAKAQPTFLILYKRTYMLKHFLIYLALSILVVLFARYAQLIVINIDAFFAFINLKLAPVFNQANLGLLARKTLVLLLLPLIIVGIPALCYQLMKKRQMPHLIATTWIVWIVLVLSEILIT
ncbi:MAG: hypothetical protein ACHP6H_02440, partial [Legionellales bacterium]